MLKRPIPSTGEMLPVVGCGTWQTFDVGTSAAERQPLRTVLQTLLDNGGAVIDSSPMYGRAEAVSGDLVSELEARERAFVATKVWTTGQREGVAQMSRSIQLMRADPIDLIQIHNLVDWRTHLKTLRDWKASGRVRYLGITQYTASAHADLEAVMRSEAIDFVQFNYALDDRAAERSLLPLAIERGIATLINRPFGQGAVVRRLNRTPLPAFASELGCEDWTQLALKYLIANEAVTCVIPATRNPEHMKSNAKAGSGPLPDAAMRKHILAAAGL
jgi:diketogulonate reductase-like aldo/keto reductase